MSVPSYPLTGVPVEIAGGRRFLCALRSHFGGAIPTRNATRTELLALNVVLRKRRLDAVQRPINAFVPIHLHAFIVQHRLTRRPLDYLIVVSGNIPVPGALSGAINSGLP